jgi:hypothetical protein
MQRLQSRPHIIRAFHGGDRIVLLSLEVLQSANRLSLGCSDIPNRRRLLLMLIIERLLHSATLTICETVNNSLNIIFWIISGFEGGSIGAMLRILDGYEGEFWQREEGDRWRGARSDSICSPCSLLYSVSRWNNFGWNVWEMPSIREIGNTRVPAILEFLGA